MRLVYETTEVSTAENFKDGSVTRRGVVGLVLETGWGKEGITKFTDPKTIISDPLYDKSAVRKITDALIGAQSVYVCRPFGSSFASSEFGRARYPGASGNSIITVCRAVSGDIDCFYEVTTYAGGIAVDSQTVKKMNELSDNSHVIFDRDAELFPTAGLPMTKGADIVMTSELYGECLSLFDSIDVDVLACTENDSLLIGEFADYVIKRRASGDPVYGVTSKALPYSGIISVFCDSADTTGAVSYTAGVIASTPFYKSIDGAIYGGGQKIPFYETLTGNIPDGCIVYERSGEKIVLRCGDGVFSERREGDAIKRVIGGIFKSKYRGKITDGELGLGKLRNEIKSVLDSFADKYGTVAPRSISVSSDGAGNVSLVLSVTPSERPNTITISAVISQ